MKITTWLAISVFLLFCSCSGMKVVTSPSKTFPPLQTNESIEVYFSEKDIPFDSEVLASVKATDTGYTSKSKCDSISVVEHLKTEARKIGGNAVYVSKHTKPSFSGSYCHQMEGSILKIYNWTSDFSTDNNDVDSEDLDIIESAEIEDNEYTNQKNYSRFRLSGDFGYGWRTAKKIGDFTDEMSSGFAFQSTFTYFYKEDLGFALNYTGYISSTIYNSRDNYTPMYNAETFINYIGIDYVLNRPIASSWRFDVRAGLGYANYKVSIKESGYSYDRYKEWGGTIGFHSSVGIDYMIGSRLSLGINLSSIAGLVRTIHIKEGGNKSTIHIDDINNAIGLGQIRIAAGIRFYFQ